jgi:hypothetical protein
VKTPNKREAATLVRQKQPRAKILEVCDISACVDDPDYVLIGSDPEELAEMVLGIFGISREKV